MMATSTASNLTRYLRHVLRSWEHDERPDAELLALFAQDRDEQAFATLVRRFSVLVWGVCYRILGHREEAEDAFQATFLVLARKAGQIGRRELVGHWLYRVARHTAQDVRKSFARRQRHEKQASTMLPTTYTDDVERPDLLAVLDKEILQLPADYRLPLILCRLEGHTYADAARSIGCSIAAVGRRVARAEELLRDRLTRRGVTLAGVSVAALLSQAVTAKGMPLCLVGNTIRAAQAFASDTLAPSLAMSIAKGVIQSMASSKVALWGAVIVTLIGAAVGVVTQFLPKAQGVVPPAASAAPPAPPEEARQDRYGDPLPPGALARLGTVRLRHTAEVRSLVFTPDGKGLLTAGGDNLPRLWDIATGKLLREFTNIPKPQVIDGRHFGVSAATLSPDGRILAVRGGRMGNLYLLETATGKRLLEFPCATTSGHGLLFNFAFSPDSKTIAARFDGRLELRDVATGQTLWQTKELWQELGQKQSVALVFSPDGKLLASSASAEGVRLWDARTGKPLRALVPECMVLHMAFSPDGRTLALGCAGGKDQEHRHSVHLWDVATGKKVQQLSAPDKGYWYPIFSPDGKIVAARREEGEICLWEAATGKQLRRWNAPFHWSPLAFSPDGKVLAALDGLLVRFWDVASGKARSFQLPTGHESAVNSVAFTPDGRTLISTAADHTVRWWDTPTGQQRLCLPATKDQLRLIGVPNPDIIGRACVSALSPDGTTLAVVCIEVPDEELLAKEKGARLPAGIRLLDAATGKELRRLDSATNKERRTLHLGNERTTGLVFSPDGQLLAELFNGRGVWLWDVASGKRTNSVALDGNCPQFSPDGNLLVTLNGGSLVRFWESATGKKINAFHTHERVSCLALSPDGKVLATGSDRITLYPLSRDKQSGIQVGSSHLVAYPPNGFVTALAFSADGRLLASGGSDQSIHLWETASGKERARLPGHGSGRPVRSPGITSLSFAVDGRRLASGGADSTILIWDVTGRFEDGYLRPAQLSAKALERLWADLGSAEAARAGRALWTLAAAPAQAVPSLAERLRTSAADTHKALAKVPQLLRDLDDDAFIVREQAKAELARLGEAAEPALRQALAKSPSLETRRSLEQLLKTVEAERQAPTGEALRAVRALEVLEQIGTREARATLKALMAGTGAETSLALEAHAALERLERAERR